MTFHFNFDLRTLDKDIGGFETSRVYFVNSSQSIESSSFLFHSAMEFARNHNVSYFCFDRKSTDIVQEMMACKSGVKTKDINHPTKEVFATLEPTLAFMQSLPLFFIDEEPFTPQDLFDRIISEKECTGSKVVIIDRLDVDFYMNMNETEQKEFLHQLVELARTYDICLIISIPKDRCRYSDSNTHNIFFERTSLDTVSIVLSYVDDKPAMPLMFDSSRMKLYEQGVSA